MQQVHPLAKKQADQKQYFDQLKMDYERVFSTPEGARILDDIKKSTFWDKDNFNENAYRMAYNSGVRSVGLHIIYMATPKSKEEVTTMATR